MQMKCNATKCEKMHNSGSDPLLLILLLLEMKNMDQIHDNKDDQKDCGSTIIIDKLGSAEEEKIKRQYINPTTTTRV